MARTPRDVTDTELALLHALWDGGPTTIQQLTEVVYGQATAGKYGTVQKLLERLEAKGYVRRERRAPAHVYRACVAREELIGRRLQDMAEKLCGGSLTPLLTHLVRAEALSSAERQELRDLIDKLDRKKRSK